MLFTLRLCCQLRRTLAELLGYAAPGDPLSSGEFALWLGYYRNYGFDADRGEWATAKAGATVANVWGARVEPAALVPKFGQPSLAERRAKLRAWLESLPDRKG